MSRANREHRWVRLVVRLDQAGSAAFIVVALALAPASVLIPTLRTVLLWMVGLGVIAYAVALAALGVFLACGLSRLMARGDELPMRTWRSLLGFAARPPEHVSVGVGHPGQDEQQVGQAVEVLDRERAGAVGVGLDQRPAAALRPAGHGPGLVQ